MSNPKYPFDSCVGKVFGQLTVVRRVANDKYSHTRFLCKCSCGKFKKILFYNLNGNKTNSCGCLRSSSVSKRTKKDLVGQSFDRLTVIKEAGRTTRRYILWECSCSCGNIHIVNSVYLLNGDVTSCGCKVKEQFGENSPSWRGGISFEPYCPLWSDKGYKADIRERDSNICQNPYCFRTDKVLNIHHIDYDKKNCHPSNLITICRTCNARANVQRDWHTKWYQVIMNKKYGCSYE